MVTKTEHLSVFPSSHSILLKQSRNKYLQHNRQSWSSPQQICFAFERQQSLTLDHKTAFIWFYFNLQRKLQGSGSKWTYNVPFGIPPTFKLHDRPNRHDYTRYVNGRIEQHLLPYKQIIVVVSLAIIRFRLKSYAVRVLYYYCKRLSGFILKVML